MSAAYVFWLVAKGLIIIYRMGVRKNRGSRNFWMSDSGLLKNQVYLWGGHENICFFSVNFKNFRRFALSFLKRYISTKFSVSYAKTFLALCASFFFQFCIIILLCWHFFFSFVLCFYMRPHRYILWAVRPVTIRRPSSVRPASVCECISIFINNMSAGHLVINASH